MELTGGGFPDPVVFVGMSYNPNQQTLYIFKEIFRNKTSNEDFAVLIEEHKKDKIIADSAEPKSIAKFRSMGFSIVGATKGPGSVEYSMKWLQSLKEIVIDSARCPQTVEEWASYEYIKDKDGNVISGYPDKNNHSIDAVRYALQNAWSRTPYQRLS